MKKFAASTTLVCLFLVFSVHKGIILHTISLVEEQISKEVSNVESLLQQNTELRDRLQFAERECETKTEFITKHDAERDHLERKVQALQLALEKVKDAQKVNFLATFIGSLLLTDLNYDGNGVNYRTRYASIRLPLAAPLCATPTKHSSTKGPLFLIF